MATVLSCFLSSPLSRAACLHQITLMNRLSSDIQVETFSVADFQRLGDRYAINYRFPAAEPQCPVIHGQVSEWQLRSGLNVTHSDVQVMLPYESVSAGQSPLFLLVVLEGSVELRSTGREILLSTGQVFCTCLDTPGMLSVRHTSGQRLVTLALGWDQNSCLIPQTLAADWLQHGLPARVRNIPGHLLVTLRHAVSDPIPPSARELVLEGTLLQLLSLFLTPEPPQERRRGVVQPSEHQRLEAVRRLLESSPEQEHMLDALAKVAAMSSSSLRSKFRQAYGESVFGYLRQCRLALAKRYLQQGYSVQQAAWHSGYQHASNFATAFRRHYGTSPGNYPADRPRTQ